MTICVLGYWKRSRKPLYRKLLTFTIKLMTILSSKTTQRKQLSNHCTKMKRVFMLKNTDQCLSWVHDLYFLRHNCSQFFGKTIRSLTTRGQAKIFDNAQIKLTHFFNDSTRGNLSFVFIVILPKPSTQKTQFYVGKDYFAAVKISCNCLQITHPTERNVYFWLVTKKFIKNISNKWGPLRSVFAVFIYSVYIKDIPSLLEKSLPFQIKLKLQKENFNNLVST